MQETQKTAIQEFAKETDNRYKKYPEYEVPSGNNLQKVPAHWEDRSFQYWAEKKSQKGDEKERDFITLEHINSTTGDLIDDFEWEMKKSEEYYLFEPDDVLFGKLRPYLRKYYQVDKKGCCGTDLLVLTPDSDVQSRYLYYFLHSEDFIQFTDANSHGVKMPRSSWRKISSANFRLPPIKEQNAIVEFLDKEIEKIDQLIKRKKQLVEFIKEKRETIVKNAVIKGTSSDVEMKDSGVDWLGEIPKHWDIPRIRFVARMESGHTPSKSEDEYWNGDIPWVSLADSGWMREYDYISETSKTISEAGIENSSARILPPETMVFTRDATVGLCAITTREMTVSQHIIGWICEDNLIPEYLLNVTKAMDQELDRLTMGATISTVGMEDIKKLKMPLPPIKEQKQIVEYLNDELEKFDNSTEKILEGVERLKEYRTALITNAVTGQIDVRGEV